MSNKKSSVVYAIDSEYISHFATSLTSLLENNSEIFENYFVVIEDSESEELKTAIRYFHKKYDIELVVLNTKNLKFDASDLYSMLPFSPATYYRLFLAELLPREIHKVLYLDADTIVLGKLEEIFQQDFNENYLLAVPESKFIVDSAPKSLVNRNLIGNEYFNAGVIFIDILKWRSESVAIELMNTGILHKENIRYYDQDILNIFFKDKIGELESQYNVFKASKKLNPKPKIIHYAGPVKPWHLFNSHPYRSEYKFYRKLTPFRFKSQLGPSPKAILIQLLNRFSLGRLILNLKRLLKK
jgi:lipopolysaccharide biosynthesis glycosyltransferase